MEFEIFNITLESIVVAIVCAIMEVYDVLFIDHPLCPSPPARFTVMQFFRLSVELWLFFMLGFCFISFVSFVSFVAFSSQEDNNNTRAKTRSKLKPIRYKKHTRGKTGK
jgi:hypothetical protein